MGRGEWGVTPYVTDTHPIKRGETRGKENVKRGEQQGERTERRLDRRGCLSKIWRRGQERAGVGGGTYKWRLYRVIMFDCSRC